MSKSKSSSSSSVSSFPPTQYVILGGISWAIVALLFYLLFSAPTELATGGLAKLAPASRPGWYRVGTYIFQTVAIAASGYLCLRNWRNRKIMSGGNVWLGLGIGIISWGIGNLIYGFLDFEYQRQLSENLNSLLQVIAQNPNVQALKDMENDLKTKFFETTSDLPELVKKLQSIDKVPAASKNTLQTLAKNFENLPQPFPSFADVFFTITYVFLSWGMAMSVIGRRLNLFPKQWAIVGGVGLGGLLIAGYVTFVVGGESKSLEKILYSIYALGDVWLLIVAAILLLAFWGGRFAQSWRLLGAAGVSMFIADLGFNWANKQQGYLSGNWNEFFWILAFVLFGMGAALEYDLSSRPREKRR